MPAFARDEIDRGLVLQYFWKGGLVFWYTKKRPLVTLSTPESELGGSIAGIKFGIGIKNYTVAKKKGP